MKILCAGHFPDSARMIVRWTTDNTETPIPVLHDGRLHGSILPNEDVVVPAFIAETLTNSSFSVAVVGPFEAIEPSDVVTMDAEIVPEVTLMDVEEVPGEADADVSEPAPSEPIESEEESAEVTEEVAAEEQASPAEIIGE